MMKKAIVLDSNILVSDFALASQKLTTLIDYARRFNHRIMLSHLVVDEVVAKYQRELTERWTKLQNALSAYQQVAHPGSPVVIPAPVLSEAGKTFRERLLSRFAIDESALLPYREHHMVQALQRAMHRRAPCSDRGEEIRDAVLWLQVLDLCRPDVELCFISSDRHAFGKLEDTLRPELLAELRESSKGVRYYSSLESFLRATADKVDFVTREWVLAAVPKERILDDAIIDIEVLGRQNLARSLREREEPTGHVIAVNYDIALQDYYVHELSTGEHVVEAVWSGSAEIEGEVYLHPVSVAEPEDLPLFGNRTKLTHRNAEFDVGIAVEILVRDRKVVKWTLVEVTDAV